MELSEIIHYIQHVPTWIWFVAGFVLLILTGDTKRWEYEVKFPMKQGVGRGEIEFKCLKKKGTSIEIELSLDTMQAEKPIDIYLNERLVYSIAADENIANKRIYINKKITIEKPREADTVAVKIAGQSVLTGQLVLD